MAAEGDVTITVSAVNRVGLSLGPKNSLMSGTEQSNYLTNINSNYIDNGDFVDGVATGSDGATSNGGTLIGTQVAAQTGTTHASGGGHATDAVYDGHTGTMHFYGNQHWYMGDEETKYWKHAMTLDDATDYHLNFLYSTRDDHCMQYSIYNATESYFITPWTVLKGTYTEAGGNRDVFKYLGETNTNNVGYARFRVPKGAVDTTPEIQLRIAPGGVRDGSVSARIVGVSVHKAHNDLTTMSYNTSSACPFYGGVQQFTNYKTRFKIPNHYNGVSDWILRLHAGQHGYRASNDIGNNASREVYFDNIKISSSSGEVITLLSDNRVDKSLISAHSTIGAWKQNFIEWLMPSCKPNYDYVNGMLKISDGNFNNTNNNNKLVYYSKDDTSYLDNENGWVVLDKVLGDGPSMTISEIETSGLSPHVYGENNETIDDLNALYNGVYRTRHDDDTTVLNWKMDVFGDALPMPESHGMLIRYFFDKNTYPGLSGYGSPPSDGPYVSSGQGDSNPINWIDGEPLALYYMEDDIDSWYQVNIMNSGGAFSGVLDTDEADYLAVFPTCYGWKTKDSGTYQDTFGGTWCCSGGTSSSEGGGTPSGYYKQEYPITKSNLQAFVETTGEDLTHIAKVEVEMQYNMLGFSFETDSSALPYWEMNVGKMGGAVGDDDATAQRKLDANLLIKAPQHYSGERFKRLGIQFKDVKPGRKVLVVPPSEKVMKYFELDLDEWIENTILQIKNHTQRPVELRKKPSREDRVSVNTMEQALADDVHCMVTFNSIAALESMIYGVPAIVLGPNCAQDICETKLHMIEFVKHPGRKQLTWLCRYLANNQFTYDEMLNGYAWSKIK